MTTAGETSEPGTPPKAQASSHQHESPGRPIDKRAAARHAKKKQRRRAHRATLKRSNTGG